MREDALEFPALGERGSATAWVSLDESPLRPCAPPWSCRNSSSRRSGVMGGSVAVGLVIDRAPANQCGGPALSRRDGRYVEMAPVRRESGMMLEFYWKV